MSLHKYRKVAKFLNGVEKVEKLNEVLALCIASYKEDPNSYTMNAMAWTLIDLITYYLFIKYLNEASYFYMLLDAIYFGIPDQWIEDKKGNLRRRIDKKYRTIDKIEGLIAGGKIGESCRLFRELRSLGQLSVINHELYGRALHQYLEAFGEKKSVDEVKLLLRKYLRLSNLKPSKLHLTIMRFAWNYSKSHTDFDYNKFITYCKVDTSKNSMTSYHNIIEVGTKEFYRLKFLKYD